MMTNDIRRTLDDPAASYWLKQTLLDALKRDPIDAANDAEILQQLLQRRAQTLLHGDTPICYLNAGSLAE